MVFRRREKQSENQSPEQESGIWQYKGYEERTTRSGRKMYVYVFEIRMPPREYEISIDPLQLQKELPEPVSYASHGLLDDLRSHEEPDGSIIYRYEIKIMEKIPDWLAVKITRFISGLNHKMIPVEDARRFLEDLIQNHRADKKDIDEWVKNMEDKYS